jgi:hypothetical protein
LLYPRTKLTLPNFLFISPAESRRRIVTDNHNAADDWIEQLLSASKITPPAAAELEVSKSLEADIGNSQNNQPTAVVADPPNGLAHDGDVVMATS